MRHTGSLIATLTSLYLLANSTSSRCKYICAWKNGFFSPALVGWKRGDTVSWWCVGIPGRSQDTLSPGKDSETWLSFSITQPVLLELRGQTAHHHPSSYAWICIKQRHGSACHCATVEIATNRIEQTTLHTAPPSSAGRLSERNISAAQ